MAIVLYLEKRKLPSRIKAILLEVEKDKADLDIPAMVLAEIGYLAEKKKIDVDLGDIRKFMSRNNSVKVLDISFEIIEQAFAIKDIPELHDRIIAAAASQQNVEIVTNDPNISNSKFVKAIWK